MSESLDVEVLRKLLERVDESGGVIAPPNYFTQVPDLFVRRRDLKPFHKILFIYLWGYAANKGHSFPKQKTMMAELGVSLPTLNTALKALEDAGGIYVVNQYKKSTGEQVANLYFIAEVIVQTGEFKSDYLNINKMLYPEKKRILENK